MQRVFKYTFEITDDVWLELPGGAEILHVAIQHGVPCLWALVDETLTKVQRQFRIAGTGHPIDNPEKLMHVGTFFVDGGALVFHMFEVAA